MSNRAGRLFLLAGTFALVATPASAQLVNGKWQAPAKTAGSSGTAPKKGVEVRPENQASGTSSQGGTVVPVRVVNAILMSDGTVRADFGSGMEVVLRSCGRSVLRSTLRVVGNGQVQPAPGVQSTPGMQPAPGMQSAPNQTTPSQAQSSAPNRAPTEAARNSCYLRDETGHVFATR